MLGVKKRWKNVPTAASGRPTCSFMAQMILGKISAIALVVPATVSFNQFKENVITESDTKDIGYTNIHPII